MGLQDWAGPEKHGTAGWLRPEKLKATRVPFSAKDTGM